jgi:hypothetical protein
MTIAERKGREAYDKINPWRPICEAKVDGTISELLFDDVVGHFDAEQRRYFLDADGCWYCIDEPGKAHKRPMNWRPAFVRLTPERRHIVKRNAAGVMA